MLKSRIRNAAAAARPVKIRGVAVTSVCVSDPSWTNAALNSLRYVGNGLWPVISKTRPAMTNAASSEPIGTATVSQRGWLSLRSRRSCIDGGPYRPNLRSSGRGGG